ncbi:delta 1-pyrroline-5-carboxylate reductase [Orbilia oligospora]|uniref:Pyrroline-5-carboxylate reductase n=1 Tax=Orbilia oligospora TaxID=2813651 RepID=A0A6G1LUR0_ORBOL|nr:delta 1-pyrroline-5-carboxylate reductase [Orbilia oligospora]KAF3205011.1 delta 1-pyrroline-5-carboxylate reductase [Orbilia oligospora]KAF3207809.1 delta 1-pyrroline-5-carboxylate reductase [Orbilia oligospora]KAF3234170.1 delta 1-pyrroline-5-carboxylate reductase [Orbilia oligospora]
MSINVMSEKKVSGLSLGFIGCGTMGVAVLSGILAALATESKTAPPSPFPSTPSTPTHLPTSFVACVKRPESATRLGKIFPQATLSPSTSPPVTIIAGDNTRGAQLSDIVILGCKPQIVSEILSVEATRDALRGKLLISICAGVTLAQLGALVDPSTRVIRVMPNTASRIRDSMTVISCDPAVIPQEERDLVFWIFSQIGRAIFLAEKHMDASTALCGSGPAFMALVLEAMADGGVMMGLPRVEAQMMAAQTMRGTAGMVLEGEHPAIIREKVSTPAGCTIGGLLILEDGRLRSTIARGIQEATRVASGLGSK